MLPHSNRLAFIFVGLLLLASSPANAGTLQNCEGVSTPQGFRYVGTYCFDYACSYTFTRVFTSYCPFNAN